MVEKTDWISFDSTKIGNMHNNVFSQLFSGVFLSKIHDKLHLSKVQYYIGICVALGFVDVFSFSVQDGS